MRMVRPMRDGEIRAELSAALRRDHPDPIDTRIWPEMTVGLGASRVDIGVVNGALSGFEIKSDRDNLSRLPRQIEHYGRCLDFAWVVCGEKYLERAKSAVPSWWGVMVAIPGEVASVDLRVVRAASSNPNLDAFHVAQLLWRDEAHDALVDLGYQPAAKARRWDLWDLLAASCELDELRSVVRERLKARPFHEGFG